MLSHWYDPQLCLLFQGLVALEAVTTPYACRDFEADIFLLFHTTAISKRFQATVHIGNVIQTATVVDLNRVCGSVRSNSHTFDSLSKV